MHSKHLVTSRQQNESSVPHHARTPSPEDRTGRYAGSLLTLQGNLKNQKLRGQQPSKIQTATDSKNRAGEASYKTTMNQEGIIPSESFNIETTSSMEKQKALITKWEELEKQLLCIAF